MTWCCNGLRFWPRFSCKMRGIISISYLALAWTGCCVLPCKTLVILELLFFCLRICQLGDFNVCSSCFVGDRVPEENDLAGELSPLAASFFTSKSLIVFTNDLTIPSRKPSQVVTAESPYLTCLLHPHVPS